MKNKFSLIIVLAFALLFALILGSKVAQGSYIDLTIYGLIVAPIVFFIWGHKYTWQIVFAVSVAGVNFYQGFIFDAVHVGSALLCVMFLVHIIAGYRSGMNPVFKRCGGRFLVVTVSLWLAYAILHFAFNFAFPHVPGDFGVKNSAKAYFITLMPPLILLWMLLGPTKMKVGKDWVKLLIWIFVISVSLNILYKGVLFASGYGMAQSELSTNDGGNVLTKFYVPIINASLSPFTLRGIAPLAVLLSLLLLTADDSRKYNRKLVWALLLLGILGAVMSGGRAAVLLSGFYGCTILLVRKKIGLLALGVAAGLLGLIFINLFSGMINDKMPQQVARPLQYLMIQKDDRVMRTISHSSLFRKVLFEASIDHWLSDPRVMMTGRSIYRYMDNEADMQLRFGDQENFIVTNLRAGTCHALLPSSLVQYGLFGTVLYYGWVIALIIFWFRFSGYCKRNSKNTSMSDISYGLGVYGLVSLLVATIGGGWLGLTSIVFVGIFRSQIEDELKAEEIS